MNLARARLLKKLNDMSRGVAVNDRVVNNNNSLAFNYIFKHVKSHLKELILLIGSHAVACSADVLVLDKRRSVRNTRNLGVALSRVKSRIGYTADDIGFNGVFPEQNLTRFSSC